MVAYQQHLCSPESLNMCVVLRYTCIIVFRQLHSGDVTADLYHQLTDQCRGLLTLVRLRLRLL